MVFVKCDLFVNHYDGELPLCWRWWPGTVTTRIRHPLRSCVLLFRPLSLFHRTITY